VEVPVPDKRTAAGDLAGGLSVAMVSIPEGMAYALIAGVDPIYGLYAGMLTVIIGSLFSSTKLMVITLTNAIALIVADSLGLLGDDIARGIATLTLLIGLIQFLLGILKLGSLVRFISNEVMAGFIAAVATIIILGQIEELVGYQGHIEVGGQISGRIYEGIVILVTPWHWDPATAAMGFLTIGVLLGLKRTKLEKFADFLVVAIIGVVVVLLGLGSVLIVQDISNIPNELPSLVAPDYTLIPGLAPAALAIAIVALIEAAGISSAFPNPDKSKTDTSRNFTAHGLANLAGSLIAALPGGGSMSRTAINLDAGSLTRFGGVFAGAIVILAVALFGPVFEYIPMTALAGLLIVIGVGILRKEIPKMVEAWHSSKAYSVSMIATYVIAVGYSLEVAVFVGVALSLILYVYFSARDVKLVLLEPLGDGLFEARPVPKEIPSNEVTVLQSRGSMYFAAVHTLQDELPSWEKSRHAVIILNMYGRGMVSTNLIDLVRSMHEEMMEKDIKLMLSDVAETIMGQFERTGVLDELGREYVFPARDVMGASITEALEVANAWLEEETAGDNRFDSEE
jgi:SulP family sulfate permease